MAGPSREASPPFGLVLLAIVAVFILEPHVADRGGGSLATRLSAMGLTVPIVVVGLLWFREKRRWWILAAVLVALLNGGGMIRLAYVPTQLGLAAALALLCWATVHVYRRVLQAPVVTPRVIAGALAAYLMVTLIWALAYGTVEVTWPGSIHVTSAAGGAAAVDVHTLMYFSAITIMTIGYGDVTPVAPIARTMAVLEGMTGIVFTTVVLGALVSTLIAGGRGGRSAQGRGTEV